MFRHFVKHFRADLHPHSARGKLVRSAILTSALKATSVALAFAASLLYARTLGPHGYGLYAYVIAWVTILAVPVGLGIPQYLVREGARNPLALAHLRRWGDIRVLASGTGAALILSCAFLIPAAADARWLFVAAAPLPVITTLGSVRSALLQAQGKVASSQWPRLLLSPASTIAILLTLWLWHGRLLPSDLILATGAGAVLATLANSVQLRTRSERDTHFSPSLSLHAALPFMFTAGLFLLNSRLDLIMLGAMRGAHDAGIYAVAARAAELTSFSMATANLVIGPKVAALYQTGERALLRRMIQAASRRVFLVSLPIAAFLIIGAEPLLKTIYGAAYLEGALPMKILALSQILVVGSGPLGTLLNMTGHVRINTKNMIYAVLLNVVLNASLIPPWGVNGAAAATCTCLLFSRFLLWRQVRHLGLYD